jgi:hypothetical protein
MKPVLAAVGMWVAASAMPADAQVHSNIVVATTMGTPRTGKERLGDKASDDQRVNDCRVPPEKRGPSKRPTECARK